jgi:protein subunit release factor B
MPQFPNNSRLDQLRERMTDLGIGADDVEEKFTHSSGPGGQNVNKTSTAVVLVHRPTGLQVRCEKERSQARNRISALELLLDKIEQQRQNALLEERALIERLRRQRRKRSRGAKERMLRDKARQSQKKKLRKSATED